MNHQFVRERVYLAAPNIMWLKIASSKPAVHLFAPQFWQCSPIHALILESLTPTWTLLHDENGNFRVQQIFLWLFSSCQTLCDECIVCIFTITYEFKIAKAAISNFNNPKNFTDVLNRFFEYIQLSENTDRLQRSVSLNMPRTISFT